MVKAKGASRAIRPGKSAVSKSMTAKSVIKSRASAVATAEPTAEANRAIGKEASQLIDGRIRELGDWRGETLARVRTLILEADPEMTEEWKWKGTPVWSHAGNICTGETYKQAVKLTFAKGAALVDPRKLFNSSLDGSTRRAIDIREGEVLDAKAFKALIQAAVAENLRSSSPKSETQKSSSLVKPGAKAIAAPKVGAKAKPDASASTPVKLLSGGNPQIAKADGDAPVQTYIAAMPGWKSDVGKRLDALIVRNVPQVRKAVKWNSPFYGIDGQGWFLSFHVFNRYVKVTFFSGKLLRPAPPGCTPKSKDVRWIDINEDDKLDEAQLAKWVKQAAAIPGWMS